jgi:hypothetical protein
MTKTQFFLLYDCSREVREQIAKDGPIKISKTPPIYLRQPPESERLLSNPLLPPEAIKELEEFVALACEYDSSVPPSLDTAEIEHQLKIASITLQLIKPTRHFCQYWLLIDPSMKAWPFSVPVKLLPVRDSNPYLHYQQHHTISLADVQRAIGILPVVSNVMAMDPNGSWKHPYGSIHRALTFFCQGYSVNLPDLPQLLWAAGLDCLFASKLDSKKWGAKTIAERLQKLWGSSFQPYSAHTVKIPVNQKIRTNHQLKDIAEHIFWLRNAYMHGGPIPDPNWLSNPGAPLESGYAYQLLECTEILLRETLLKLIENPNLFGIFLDPVKLDSYFP